MASDGICDKEILKCFGELGRLTLTFLDANERRI